MQTTKKKPSLIFILVGAVLAGYLGYLINGAWIEGIAFNEFMDRFNEVCAVPFANYYNSNTVKAVAIALGIYAMAIVMYYTSQRNYMPGKEFGTARFENPKQVNKILADKDENFNRILSQNVKMSLDFRRLKLNGKYLSVVVPEQEKHSMKLSRILCRCRITVPLSVPIQRGKSLEAVGRC